MRKSRRASSRGFTLIEMAIAVAIIGVLSVLAIVGYRKLTGQSHMHEATGMIMKIRMAQTDRAARGFGYANISPDLDTTYPASAPDTRMWAWGGACGGQCNSGASWADLDVKVTEPVMFGYATTAGLAGTAVTPSSVSVEGKTITFIATTTSPVDWYLVSAKGDTNGDGTFCRVYGTSISPQIFVDNDGE